MAEKWTKTSLPPSRSMKPKPLSPLNHLTVPIILSDIVCLLWQVKNFFRRLVCSIGVKQKQPTDQTVSCGCSSNQRNYRYPTKMDNNRQTRMSQSNLMSKSCPML